MPGYSTTFTSAFSWTLNGDYYQITISKVSHGKTNPIVTVYETNGANFDEVKASVSLDSSDNVTISVSSSPDLRFTGKLTIS